MSRALGCLLLVAAALAGCAKLPVATAASRAQAPTGTLFFSHAQTSVKALLKDITAQLSVRDAQHSVTVTDLSALPSVIWNVFNVDATVIEARPGQPDTTYEIVGTYDVLTKQLTVVDRSQVSPVPADPTADPTPNP